MIYIKNKNEILLMKKAGKIAKGALVKACEAVRPGITTKELDAIAEKFIKKCNAIPSFYNYNGYPGNVCISINDEVVHGIPGNRVIEEGDIVSIDCGACFGGYHGDCADTVFAGNVCDEWKHLVEITKESFYVGIKQAVDGNRIGDISYAVQNYAEKNGYSIVRELEGHGVGTHLHEGPSVPNFGTPGRGARLVSGMTIAVEPMINLGKPAVYCDSENGWTYKTVDGKPAAHYENTILITKEAPIILTEL